MIAWGGQYLRAFENLCAAGNMVALAHSLGRDAGWCTRKRGGYADTWRQRYDKGCAIIAAGLIRDRIPVPAPNQRLDHGPAALAHHVGEH